MQRSINLRCFPAMMPLRERIDVAARAGYDAVEVNLERGTELSLEHSSAALESFAADVRERGLEISGVYSRDQWRSPITSGDPDRRADGEAIVTGLVQAAARMGTDAVLVLPGAVDNAVFASPPEVTDYEVAYHRSQESMARLAPTAAAAGVTLAVENIWNKFLLSPLEMRRYLDEIGSPAVGAYFDVGNVLAFGYPEQWIRILGHRIRRVHVKDYKRAVGTLEGFTGLFQGDVDWIAVRAALRAVGYSGYVTVEVLPAYRHYGAQLAHDAAAALSRWLADDEAAAASTPSPGPKRT